MRILFLSNGHGEDLIGSRLAAHLAKLLPGARLLAFPLVGSGPAWRKAGVPVLGAARDLPSGGLTFHSAGNLLADLRAGIVPSTWRQFRDLRAIQADALVVTGDIWALALSQLVGVPATRRFVVQTLVSARQLDAAPVNPTRLFMEHITAPERLLQRRTAARVWLRDGVTAAWLRERCVSQASYAGSLLHDQPPLRPPSGTAGGPARVLLLPGSRAWAQESLARLLALTLEVTDVRFDVAWALPRLPDRLPDGWQLSREGQTTVLVNGGNRVGLQQEAFDELLAGAGAAVGTAGTAAEQVAAAGVPMLTFELPGRHTRAFLANQKRILGAALYVSGSAEAGELARALAPLLHDPLIRQQAAEAGRLVLGEPGGLQAIAGQIREALSAD